MKIAWFTPLRETTGISKYSISAVKALSSTAEVEIWCPKPLPLTSDRLREVLEGIPIYEVSPEAMNWTQMEGYDAIVYNLGNNIRFHREIYEVSNRLKGIVILHDKVMHHFFATYFLICNGRKDTYARIMSHYYIENTPSYDDRVWETEKVLDYPLSEMCLINALGVVVHSHETFRAIVKKGVMVPVKHIHHPWYFYGLQEERPRLSRQELGLPEDKVILLFSGNIGRTKRLDMVIESIANDGLLRNNLYFLIIGEIGDKAYGMDLKNRIADEGLSGNVKLLGFVDDEILLNILHNADVCVNLRYPSTESASGSLIEQMYFGKPVIVNKIGFYNEVPDDCVVKVKLNKESGGLRDALKRLVVSPQERMRIGEKAAKWVRQNHSPDEYAAEFLEFANNVWASRGRVDFVDKVTEELRAISTNENFVSKISMEIASMFTPLNLPA